MPNMSRLRWMVVGATLLVGVVLMVTGVRWGAVLAGIGLLGFVGAAWIDVRPQGGGIHVHDSGMSAYGVSDAPPDLVHEQP